MRVPGIGSKSALRILKARRMAPLSFDSIRKMGVVLKRAQYFITCNGKMHVPIRLEESFITRQLTGLDARTGMPSPTRIHAMNSYLCLIL